MIFLLNPVFNYSKSLLSFSADKVTTGTYNFASFILNVAFVGALIASTGGSALGLVSLVALLVNTQDSDQVKVKETSQLINGITSVLQKLLKYFNGTAILTFSFSKFPPSNFPVILAL